jgi:SpoVK/Ycf46/Vps4 family AAA+-type ATPase
VLDQSLKDTIYRPVVAHSTESSHFDDFVKGKGKGLIGLFFGPPGAGKTLTAEAIAETAQMPLYAVSSGALGHEATQIHTRLSTILKLAGHWKAVLLLDEADVSLAQRSITDIKRNAIVSIFLRELEYYQGILILTTNQVEVIDEAFQSRIHLSLRYPSLDRQARLRIWRGFMEIARGKGGVRVDVDKGSLEELAGVRLNGRQVSLTSYPGNGLG